MSGIPRAVLQWWPHFNEAGRQYKLDPYLLAAIAWRESRGGDALTPPGPEGTGDVGHGHGIMQIDDRSHARFIAEKDENGMPLWTKPRENILEGARILREECLHHFPDEEGLGVAAYNCGAHGVNAGLSRLPPGATPLQRLNAVDAHTTGGDYAVSVLKHRTEFAAAGA